MGEEWLIYKENRYSRYRFLVLLSGHYADFRF